MGLKTQYVRCNQSNVSENKGEGINQHLVKQNSMYERKFIRIGKENTAAVSSEKIYTQFTLDYVPEKMRERVRVTGDCIALRQVSSPEQSPTKTFIAPSYFNTNRPVYGLFYWKIHDHRFTITGTRKHT